MAKRLNTPRDGVAVLRATSLEKEVAGRNIRRLLDLSNSIERSLNQIELLDDNLLTSTYLDPMLIKKNTRILTRMATDRQEINRILSQMERDIGNSRRDTINIFPTSTREKIDDARRSRNEIIRIVSDKIKRLAKPLSNNSILPSSITLYDTIVNPLVKNLGMSGVILEDGTRVEDFLFDQSFDKFKITEVYQLYGIKGMLDEDDVKMYFAERFDKARRVLYESFYGAFRAGDAVRKLIDTNSIGDAREFEHGNKNFNILELFEKVTGDVLRLTRPRLTWGEKEGKVYLMELKWLMMKNDDPRVIEKRLTEYAENLVLDSIDYFGYAEFKDFKRAYWNNAILDSESSYSDKKYFEIFPMTAELMVKELVENKVIRRVGKKEYSKFGISPKIKFAYVRTSETQEESSTLRDFERYFESEGLEEYYRRASK